MILSNNKGTWSLVTRKSWRRSLSFCLNLSSPTLRSHSSYNLLVRLVHRLFYNFWVPTRSSPAICMSQQASRRIWFAFCQDELLYRNIILHLRNGPFWKRLLLCCDSLLNVLVLLISLCCEIRWLFSTVLTCRKLRLGFGDRQLLSHQVLLLSGWVEPFIQSDPTFLQLFLSSCKNHLLLSRLLILILCRRSRQVLSIFWDARERWLGWGIFI